jgi:hypothetical protein
MSLPSTDPLKAAKVDARASALFVAACSLVACTPVRAVGPMSYPAGYTRDDWEACPNRGASTCCEAIEQRLAQARGRQDDRIADQELERLALNCPDRTKGVFGGWANEDERRCPADLLKTAQLSQSYTLRVSTEDRIFWTAIYFDRARPPWLYVASDARELVVEMHVLSGEAPTAGKLFKLRKTQPLALAPGDAGEVRVKLVRQPGPDPFLLDAEISAQPKKVRFTQCPPPEGTVGLGCCTTPARLVVPPSFDPPRELREAGLPGGRGTSCEARSGDRVIHLSTGQDHPRRVGAALDWLRRFEYEPGSRPTCDTLTIDFKVGNPSQQLGSGTFPD